MMNKIELTQFKIVMMASAIMISGVAIFSVQEIPEANAEPFVGEMIWFAGNFAPRGWAQCDGQLLQVSQNDALFSLLGTQFGGDGRTTFGLPDMRGRIAVGDGQGPGLTNRPMGQKAGAETVALTSATNPAHTHTGIINVNNEDRANEDDPAGKYLTKQFRRAYHDSTGTTTTDTLAGAVVGLSGGGQAHNNMMPFQVLNCNISLFGVYPSRS